MCHYSDPDPKNEKKIAELIEIGDAIAQRLEVVCSSNYDKLLRTQWKEAKEKMNG